MDEFNFFLLGIIQGLTEFLPISSSGHIEIAKGVLKSSFQTKGLLLTLILHSATALSTIWVFKKDLLIISQNFFITSNRIISQNFILNIIISMIPSVLVGFFLKDLIYSLFNANLLLVGIMLIITGIILFLADKSKVLSREITPFYALIIGLTQALAILPGISRSGSTIAIAIFLGINKSEAARFSFLMVIPLIFGSMIKTIIDYNGFEKIAFSPALLIGFVSAFFTGILACKWMISLVKKSNLKYFGYYCLILGTFSLFYGNI
ncbi:MAG: UDP-diphosphatase [Flavobacteriaceae bacterium]|nr:UDP-diphosphatase [Flavobacteriaceae bacterium]|tara:strand:+ start:55973 stop:56764 length:792 start_codon:yes stop_codon:yes gene_type:complete